MFWKPDFERFFCRNFTARNWNNQWGASWKMFKAAGKKGMEERHQHQSHVWPMFGLRISSAPSKSLSHAKKSHPISPGQPPARSAPPPSVGFGSVGRRFTSEPRSHANFARVRTVDMLGYMCFFVFCWVHFFGRSNLSIVQFLDGKSTVFSDWCRSPRFSHPLLFGGLLPHRPSHLRDRRKTALNEAQGRSHIYVYI